MTEHCVGCARDSRDRHGMGKISVAAASRSPVNRSGYSASNTTTPQASAPTDVNEGKRYCSNNATAAMTRMIASAREIACSITITTPVTTILRRGDTTRAALRA